MHIKALLRWSVLTSLAFGPVLACGDDEEEEVAGHSHATCGLQENCTDEAVELRSGLKIEGEQFTVELTEAEWVDVETETVHWMAKITDSDGEPVDDATLFVDVYSIDCMHGGFEPGKDVTADDDGMYMLMPPFLHGGPWDLELKVTRGDVEEELSVEFCIPGEAGEDTDHSDHEHDDEHDDGHDDDHTDAGVAEEDHSEHMGD